MSRKTRFLLGPEEFDLLWNGLPIPLSQDLIQQNQNLEMRKLKERVFLINSLISSQKLRPSCIIRYRREAFEGQNIRLTVDDHLTFETVPNLSRCSSFYDLNPMIKEAALKMHSSFDKSGQLLVEIKHAGSVPPWMKDILHASDSRKAKFSKYCYSITEALLSKH